MGSSVWYTVITMTTVGYGDSIAVTPVGRCLTIITIISGAYIMSIVIAL
jgi:riboflavin synthase alpha subunit